MAFNLVQIRELAEKKDDELDLIESGPNEVGGHVYAGGAGDPRQFAVSLSLSPDHSMDANFEREWERLRSAFVDILLPKSWRQGPSGDKFHRRLVHASKGSTHTQSGPNASRIGTNQDSAQYG